MINIMRSLHGAYAPKREPFGSRLEILYIGMCVALGQFEERPFSVAKLAAFMGVPRTTVIRRLDRAQRPDVLAFPVGHAPINNPKEMTAIANLQLWRGRSRIMSRIREERTMTNTSSQEFRAPLRRWKKQEIHCW
jgi:hypothetical protein